MNATLARLVAFDTTSARSNIALIEWVAARLAEHGVEAVMSLEGQKANLHAIIGPRVAGGIALSAHVDCVPVTGQAWLADPFTLREEAGRLIGRGATDMKGFLACVLDMVPAMLAAPLRRPFHLCLTHDEETSFQGAARLMPLLEGPLKPEFCVVGEPTRMAPVLAHKGYASWDVTFTGITGHSSRTDATANALMAAAEAIAWLAAEQRRHVAEGRRVEGFEPPYTTVQAGIFTGGSVLNIVPDVADFAFEVRAVPGDDPQAVRRAFEAHVTEVVLPHHPGCGMRLAVRSLAPPLGLSTTHPLAQLTQRATGRNATGCVSFGTEAGYYEAAGIPAIVCGPGDIAQAHEPEEWIEAAQLEQCQTFLERLIERQCR